MSFAFFGILCLSAQKSEMSKVTHFVWWELKICVYELLLSAWCIKYYEYPSNYWKLQKDEKVERAKVIVE